MDSGLLLQATKKFVLGLLVVGLLIFLPAGTIDFPNGWLFIGLLFIPMLIMGIIIFIKNPALLQKRLNAKEKESEQKLVVLLSGLMFISAFVLAGLNYRFNLTKLPSIIVTISSIIFLLAYVMYIEVLRENEYLSRTIEVDENQKVIDKGLYGIVRHPMYTSTIFLFLSMPLILGSIYSFVILLIYPILIAFRIRNEEKVLEHELDGYREYKNKVNYKIFPLIW
ncbi:isoprenylcysteine carboxylmethyltransferase family protein [Methanobrevibacter sp.]|uniref:methyltransferase family protein n=1 Tax=Methanobrevibacter sp. TaxID=66852 RepID=UPI0025D15FCC|nr:isoprenylcysteine carboxylmethyltransferase family protein [Methanobrevibacter sp.]MBQ6512379.1 isoprenylcysteine carboxylmethyltransferase family protein [Methanobrevibacter sp.]